MSSHAPAIPIVLALALSLASACTAPRSEAPELMPTPYTAEEIQRANPPGTVLVYEVEQAGEPPTVRTVRFLADDGERATFEAEVTDAHGALVSEPQSAVAPWTELRDHAAFPADVTTRSRTSVEVPAGRFECWLYTVREPARDGRPSRLRRFYFADARPGSPVLYEIAEQGVVVYRMTLREHRR